MDLELHFKRVDSCKDILFNTENERQEHYARVLLKSVLDEENYIYVGGEN